jgi:hypothetical protein
VRYDELRRLLVEKGLVVGRWCAGATDVKALAVLLVVSLLFCHGLLGPVHQLSAPVEPHGEPLAAGAAAGSAEPHSGGHGELHLGSAEYAAALMMILLGTVLGLLLRGTRLWHGSAALRLPRIVVSPLIPRYPRQPSAPALQVFRL